MRGTRILGSGPAKFLILAFTLLFGTHSHALSKDDAENIIYALEKIQVYSYQSVNAYYQFSMNEGDKKIQEEISRTSGNLTTLINQLDAMPGAEEMAGEIATLQAIYEDFDRLLKTNVNDIIEVGYSDIRMVSELASANLTQVNGAGIAIEQALEYAGIKESERDLLIRQSRIYLLSLVTRYSARSASTVSQVFQGAETELSSEELSGRLDTNFDKLTDMVSGNAEARIMDNIRSKWGFIRKSFENMAENSVPFVVNLYSQKIVEQLDELEGNN